MDASTAYALLEALALTEDILDARPDDEQAGAVYASITFAIDQHQKKLTDCDCVGGFMWGTTGIVDCDACGGE